MIVSDADNREVLKNLVRVEGVDYLLKHVAPSEELDTAERRNAQDEVKRRARKGRDRKAIRVQWKKRLSKMPRETMPSR